MRRPPRSRLFPYTTLFRSCRQVGRADLIYSPTAMEKVLALDVSSSSGYAVMTESEGAFTLGHDRVTRARGDVERSEEHTSELQSHSDLVCRLLLEKKKTTY